MNNHVPNDGTPDGCWCERMWFIRDLPWWWPFPFRYWGPFAPAEFPKEPLPIPPVPERSVSEAGGDACLGVVRRRRCNQVAGCQWEGPRKANKGGHCVASGVSTAAASTSQCSGLRKKQCRKTAGCDFDRGYKQCLPTGDVAQAVSAGGVDMCHNLRPRRCRRARRTRRI